MEDLLKKLDEIMTKNIVGKIGGLFCFIVVILSLAGFFVGAGSLLSSMKKPEAAVEAPAEEASEEEIFLQYGFCNMANHRKKHDLIALRA